MARTATPSKLTVKVLTGLLDQRGAVARELGATKVQVNPFIEAGVVKVIGTRKNTDENGKPLRGRPSMELALTDKGRKQAKRLIAAQVEAQESVTA